MAKPKTQPVVGDAPAAPSYYALTPLIFGNARGEYCSAGEGEAIDPCPEDLADLLARGLAEQR